jgi:hypothetical protein
MEGFNDDFNRQDSSDDAEFDVRAGEAEEKEVAAATNAGELTKLSQQEI